MARSDDLEKWRMGKTRKELMLNRRHTRICKLCGNQHPLTAEYFMKTDQADRPGMISGGLLFVCKSCQAHWGPTLSEDVKYMAAEVAEAGRFAGKYARSYVDNYATDKGAE